jgi:carbon monoxide dehydrogenase subunit G
MIHLERTLEIDAPPDDVWALLGNFMHADEFGPELESIDALTDGADRAGSKRRSNFTNGTSLVEEILEWEPERRYHRIQLSEMSSMPLDDAYSRMYVEPTDNGLSMVTWDFDFRVKYGPFGWLLGQTMMKMMMSKVIDANLEGLSEKVKAN